MQEKQKGIIDIASEVAAHAGDSVQETPKNIRLYVVEEQEILRVAYGTFFPLEPGIDLIGLSNGINNGMDIEALANAMSRLKPDVVLMGTKVLQAGLIDGLELLREKLPYLGIVLMSALYDAKGIKRLRAFAKKESTGCAFLFKHSVDTIGQLAQVVQAVSQGRIILDPGVMGGLIESSESTAATFLKGLTPRELEILNWMARGFKNQAIADIMCLEPKTIERHINSVYVKLSPTADSKDPRVNAITLYLRATGQLPSDGMAEE